MTKYILFILFVNILQTNAVWSQAYVVGGDSDYAPFSFVDKMGIARGLDIDLLNALAVESNIEFTYMLSRWDSAINYIQSGKIDIITGIIFSEERELFVDYTFPIHTEYYSIFIRKNLKINNITSLYDYSLAVLDKDVSIEKYLIPMGLYNNFLLVKSFPEALAKIESGNVDYVVAPYSLGMNEIEKNDYKNIKIEGPPILPSIYCMAVKKGNTKLLSVLNSGISALRNSGKLSEIKNEWKVYELEDFQNNRIAHNIKFILIIAYVILILVFIWVWLLRVQIRKKTKILNLKNQELQKSEEKFRLITENSSDIIWHLDKNFLTTYISPADERMRGFKQEEVIGTYLWSILKPEGIQMLKESNELRMAMDRKGEKSAPVIYELEEVCKDGSWVWVEATATAYYDTEGNITGYHGVTRDISERKKAEQALRESEKQLKELNATKDKLFSIIAHDLRSPFNSIIGFSTILADQVKNKEMEHIEEYSNIISTASQNAMDLLSNLMEWALSQTGKIIFTPKMLDVNTLINENVDFYTDIAKQKSISISNTTNVPSFVVADRDMINAVLRNLISNAIKFTPFDGSVEVSSGVKNNHVVVAVSDTGIGLSKTSSEKLFSLETQESKLGTQNEKGTGLGLMLCKEFIDKHQGTLKVVSEFGKGSVFSFNLPCNPDELSCNLSNGI